MRYIYEAARYLVGALFIFSGIIKINDPIGTAIKLEEYFEVFAYDFAPFFEWFVPAALFLAILLSVLEVVLGIALIIGFKMPRTSWALLLMIIFFTFLTFYSAYFNKVTDCGCFGDAIKLTPWESFYKDIILLVLIVAIFINRHNFKPWFSEKFGYIKVIGSTVVFTLLANYAVRHLPFIDFRAYAIGNHLPTLMQPSEELKYEYVMTKEGEEFTFDSYPSDKSFEFKAMNLVNPEAQPKITDLSVWNDDGDFTEQLLTGDKLLFIIYSVDKASTAHIDEIKSLAAQVKGAEPWVLTASGYEDFERFRHEVQLAVPYFYADATVLKTMVRSNPGIMLLSNGTVLGKWHQNDTPEAADINRLLP
ncbi:BT_3928 family protein [Marinoscillum sp.]|uniref:BT_3928 family protein n=1 Tax=Marinoscillum sp. TaxID=2024838 RepID=UPI003BAD5D02